MRALATRLLVLAALAAASTLAAAQQSLYVITPRLVYLPQDGVALNAATGRVQWRIDRLDGSVLTDGHGLVIYSYLAGIDDLLHFHQYRVCRARPENGKSAWCFLVPHLEEMALSAAGDYLFLRRRRELEIRATATGHRLCSFQLGQFEAPEMLALPDDGVAILDSSLQRSRLLTISLGGDSRPTEEMRVFDHPLHAFHGPGPGVLWYAPSRGQFVAISDILRPTGYGGDGDSQSFPRALADQRGFLIERRQRAAWSLAGGLYRHTVWARQLGEHSRLFLRDAIGLLLSARPAPVVAAGGGSGRGAWSPSVVTRISAVALADGHLPFSRDLRAEFQMALLDPADQPAPAVALFGRQAIVLLDAADGRIRWWRDYSGDQPAAMTAPAVLVWEDGMLAALARDNGDVLWRVRFRLAGKR